MIIEVGARWGEYQNILFLEARAHDENANAEDVAFILVSYLPIPDIWAKMKPSPRSMPPGRLTPAAFRRIFIVARGRDPLDKPRREKLALFCGLRSEDEVIFRAGREKRLRIPAVVGKNNFLQLLCKKFKFKVRAERVKKWNELRQKIKERQSSLKKSRWWKIFRHRQLYLVRLLHFGHPRQLKTPLGTKAPLRK